ncbi:Membrane protein, partial [Globisporangium splendens]
MMEKKWRVRGCFMAPPWFWTTLATTFAYALSPLHQLPGGDSGELMAEACVNGVAHPPGYPLLLTLLRISYFAVRSAEQLLAQPQLPRQRSVELARIPFVSIANVMNAGLSVAAAACITHTIDVWGRHDFPFEATTAGLMFATSKLTWGYAIGLEVH